MINEEWNKTQNDAPFVAFYDMRVVTFVLSDEMADVSIAGLQWFILIPRLNHTGSHMHIDSHSKPYLHREKKIWYIEQKLPSLLQSYGLRGKQSFVSDFSRLLRHVIEKGRGPVPRDPTGSTYVKNDLALDSPQNKATVGKGKIRLNLSQMTNFRIFQTETVCRR